jgi:hypothetical protein
MWMYLTIHRWGDMRRLIRQYGRTQDKVFPTGTYFKGGVRLADRRVSIAGGAESSGVQRLPQRGGVNVCHPEERSVEGSFVRFL